MRSFRGRLTRGAGQPALLTGMHPRCGSQTRQGPHDVVGPPTQVPPRHVSPVVHASPSLHATPSGAGSRTQAPRPSQRLGPHRSVAAPHCVPAGAGPPRAQIPSEQVAPTVHSVRATLPSIVRLEQKDSAWPLAVNVPAAAANRPAWVTAPMSVQEPVMDRAESDCEISTRHPTVAAGPETVWARTPHLPLMSVEPKTTGAMPKRNASCKTGARTSASLPPESPAGQSPAS